MSVTSPPSRRQKPTQDDQSEPPVKRISTEELLEGHRIIGIVPGDKVYRLYLTRTDRLILNA